MPVPDVMNFRYVYGPVPSRRLGHSLGIDLVPFKVCTYDCIYCQLGRTTMKTLERAEYVPIEDVLSELENKLPQYPESNYITIAGSGEPTLHSGIGTLIERIKALTDIPLAVLTNGSLLWMRDVQDALMRADVVLPSLDAGDENLFQHINRPYEMLSFKLVVDGIAEFTRRFPGDVWLEVFLLGGMTGLISEVKKIAAIVSRIAPARTQLNTICRPPAEDFAVSVSKAQLEQFKAMIPGVVEIITEDKMEQPGELQAVRPSSEEVLALLDRRPCTVEDIAKGLRLNPLEAMKWVEVLTKQGSVASERVGEKIYYVRLGRAKSV